MQPLSNLTTESRNPRSMRLDEMPVRDILLTINDEDRTVADAVRTAIPAISTAVEQIVKALRNGGRLFYVGAGTSGRLGVIDAAECMPTFGLDPNDVQAILAGGALAMTQAVEDIEDNEELSAAELQKRNLSDIDVIVGISASGRTPYVIGALNYARTIGTFTIAISCNSNAAASEYADCAIEAAVGPEVLSGSTRMKAATAQKMILNMLSTAAMVRLGKVYENLMVDVQATNLKLIERAKRIVMHATNVSYETAESYLRETGQDLKTAIVMIVSGAPLHVAQEALQLSEGYVRDAIERAKNSIL